ncbi:ABC transporter ATP-binding protein [Patulibacter defluvii]|uniref:ABC transporter ATP-binding protein n=1 Tax=Patulibacter defluvii TaxID=3095358 RepID=UPI002A754893|nr:ABC transporter ATP-binding protein [Patulibacter sp. DM4]
MSAPLPGAVDVAPPPDPPVRGAHLFRQVVRDERRRIAISAAGGILHQTTEALVPVVIGVVVDRAIAPGDGGALVLWLALLAALFVVLTLAYRIQFTVGMRAREEREHDLRLRLTRRILDPAGIAVGGSHAPADAVGSTGALVNVAGSDARETAQGLQGVVVGIAAVAALAVSAVALLTISLPLGLLILLGTPPVVVALALIARPLERRSAAQQARAAEAASVASDLVRGIRVLKGIGGERAAVERYRGASQRAKDATLRAAVADSVLEGANVLIGGAFLALVAYVGGRLALDGQISIGDLVAAVGLTQFLIGPLQRLGWALGLLAQARGSAGRVATVLAVPPAVAGGSAPLPPEPAGALRVDGLDLGPGGPLTFHVAAGEQVGIVAPDPAEATRLLDRLARRRDPRAGTIAVDGTAIDALPVADAYRLLLVADHDADLFAGSVEENLTAAVAGPPLDGDRRAALLAASGADEAIAALPDGADSPVGERGGRLSGGQRQRVALARALAADPPVLVLHDPTTAVDAVTEARIATGLAAIRRDRTTLVIATSPALLAACDRVLLLEGGRIAAAGAHDELARTVDRYREAVLR